MNCCQTTGERLAEVVAIVGLGMLALGVGERVGGSGEWRDRVLGQLDERRSKSPYWKRVEGGGGGG